LLSHGTAVTVYAENIVLLVCYWMLPIKAVFAEEMTTSIAFKDEVILFGIKTVPKLYDPATFGAFNIKLFCPRITILF